MAADLAIFSSPFTMPACSEAVFCQARSQEPELQPQAPADSASASPTEAGPCTTSGTTTGCQPARRWYDILAQLQGQDPSSLDVSLVQQLLCEALEAVKADPQWNCSGIFELLARSVSTAERGAASSAAKMAVGLLDFVKMVQKYRQVLDTHASSSGSGKRNGTDAELDPCNDDEACGPLKRQKSADSDNKQADSEPCPAAPCAVSQPARPEFAVPHLPAKRLVSQSHQQSHQHRQLHELPSASGACSVWTGSVRHNVKGRWIEYCRLSVQVPKTHACELGGELEVVQLAPRRNVGLGQYKVCKCTLLEPTRSQLLKLKSMANNELVGVVPLEDNGLLVVPYLDNSGDVKVVCFLLVL